MVVGHGSFLEVSKILPLLTNPTAPDQVAFHVVAISLPEFGFSDAPKKLGFKAARYAEVAHKIMLSLRYDEYSECRVYRASDGATTYPWTFSHGRRRLGLSDNAHHGANARPKAF